MAARRAGKAVRSAVRRGHPAADLHRGHRARPACWHAVRLRLGGRTVAHNNEPGHCPGSSEPAAGDVPLACWLPGKDGLTPHGLRHGHKTWMTEDGIRGRRERPAAANRWSPRPPTRTGRAGRPGQRCR
jgi:hypothetical protein